MNKHYLKTWPKYFDAVARGEKTFELRADDRDYKVGDILVLQRFDPKTSEYTGAEIDKRITYILRGTQFAGVAPGYCVLALGEVSL